MTVMSASMADTGGRKAVDRGSVGGRQFSGDISHG